MCNPQIHHSSEPDPGEVHSRWQECSTKSLVTYRCTDHGISALSQIPVKTLATSRATGLH